MKTIRLLSFAICFSLSLLASAQTRLVEKIDATPGQLVIPYSKYVLPNGLTLIVHEDRSDPIVHVDVTYHVGSAREEIGKSGFAHFFEHMMFQGSDNVGDEQHFKIVTEAGGTLNGSTNRDRTNYYETVPTNQLEKMLWLEADRMGYFLDAVTQRKFEVQRDTVKNERGQNYDNRPYGLASEVVSKTLYPYGHPYSWLTIGYIEDLNRVNVGDLKNFFLRWYGPNNATVTIGGDVEAAKVVALVEKYFGAIPRGPEVKPTMVPAPTLTADRYVTLHDNYARLPQLAIVLPSMPLYHPDEPALDCLAEILGQGKNSILYQHLTKNQKALDASASNRCTELGGEFWITVTPAPNLSLAETKKLVDDAIKAFEVRGVTDEDVAKFTGSIEASIVNQLQSVSGKVSQLAQFQTIAATPNLTGQQLKAYTSVTKADVLRVYEKYLKGKPAVILSVTTKTARENIVASDNYVADSATYQAPDYGYAGLRYTKGKDTFDRTQMPGNGSNPTLKVPPFWQEDFLNGLRAIGVEYRELPTIAFTLSIPGGQLLQGEDRGKAGLARLHALLLEEDTQARTAEQIQVELGKLGSSISVNASVDHLNFSVQTLTKNLDRTIVLLEERLLRPKFTTAAFDRIKKQTLEGFKSLKAQPAVVANEVFARLNYGPQNILGISQRGTESTIGGITLEDIETYHARAITSRGASLVVVGDVGQKEILGRLAFLTKLPDREIELPAILAAPTIERTRIYLVDVPRAAQTEFRVGYVTDLKFDATGEFYRAGLMNYVLGGAFNSRVNLNLREDKGWTYGASSGFAGDKYTGGFVFGSGIRANVTAEALAEVIKEFEAYRNTGITEAELSFTKSAIGQRDARRYETPIQKAGMVRQILEYDLPADFVDRQSKILASLDKSEIDRLAKKWVKTDAVNIVLVGDKATILPGLQKAGFEIVELDVNGDRVPAVAANR